MPQLDSFAYFNQVFWVIVLFLFFYGVVIKQLLPFLTRILKVRFKKTELGRSSVDVYQAEKNSVQTNFDSLVISSWNLFLARSNASINESARWVKQNYAVFDSKNSANSFIIKSVGHCKIRQNNIESKLS